MQRGPAIRLFRVVVGLAGVLLSGGLAAANSPSHAVTLDTLSPLAGHALALSVVAIAALVARRSAGIVLVAGIAMTGIINAAPALINPDGHLASIGAMRRLIATGPEGGAGLRVLQLNAWNSNRDIALAGASLRIRTDAARRGAVQFGQRPKAI